jgi:SagB-type dehydrogenase family enzyme
MYSLVVFRCVRRLCRTTKAAFLLLMLWPLFGDAGVAAQEPAASDELIALPAIRHDGEVSVEHALTERRSVRDFTDVSMSLMDLSQLLWASQGVTEKTEEPPEVWTGSQWMGGLRTAPSAGGLYPLELYVVAGNVSGLDAGLYRYVPLEHSLERAESGDLRGALGDAALGQRAIYEAPVVLVIAAIFERTAVKYGARAERYVHIEVGAAAENAFLQAEALGLGALFIGAFNDKAVKEALGLPQDHEALGIMPVGQKADDWKERRFSEP